ncbi:hypothetical protein GHT06_012976 [Daphnia sinensis]|uniref:Uncharacterized protein n=1 Tax=Daphnia sinensis TaxID=1820382 RepID=A0AAD5KZA8_9CRUS|nr:hypothetical protein GHT06_012976 [Daphnia sinensis]
MNYLFEPFLIHTVHPNRVRLVHSCKPQKKGKKKERKKKRKKLTKCFDGIRTQKRLRGCSVSLLICAEKQRHVQQGRTFSLNLIAMTVTTFRAPLYFITVLVLTSWISFINPAHAASDSTRRSSRHPKLPSTVLEDFVTDVTHKKIENHANTLDRRLQERKLTQEEMRIIESFVGLGFKSIIDVMTAVANVLNARSNIDGVDRFMKSFNSLFASTGGTSLNRYYFLIANFWVVYDAAAMIFRAWENRIAERKDNVEAQEAQDETNNAIEETLAALREANTQLTSLKDNLADLIRRQDIARRGVAGKRNPSKRKMEISSSFDGTEGKNDKEYDEEVAEENSVEPFTSEEAVSFGYERNDGGRAESNIPPNQTFNENDIPD